MTKASSPKRNRQRGRRAEKEYAKLLSGKPQGLYGGEDVTTENFSVEVKSREKCVISNWYDQCDKNNKADKINLLIVHLKNHAYKEGYAVVKISDFLRIAKDML